jgi:alpha-galactosidase/6-phospho-beta-glucosidase family protein
MPLLQHTSRNLDSRMPSTTKIVFLGATSMSFGLSMLRDIFSSDELRGSTLTMVGRNPVTLQKVADLARILNAKQAAGLTIEQTTDRRAALDGAGFVVNATAIDRNRLWKLDWEVPRKYGIRHTLGENGGPGGLMFTLRTLPLVFDLVREMEELCPTALLINFSNPESRIILALGKYSPIRALGLCHGIFMGRSDVSRIMEMPWEQLDILGAGINHFQCLLHIRNPVTGEDLYPVLRAKEKKYDPSFAPLTRRLYRAFGYWMTCSDEHLGEYLAYGWEGGENGYDFAADERGRMELAETVDSVLAGGELPAEWVAPSGEQGGAAIEAILHNKKRVLASGIVYNRGVIPNLPADAAVEVPVMADTAGIHPISLGPLPDPIAKLLTQQVHVQQLAVEAAVRASKEIALQALLIDPVVNSASAAVKLLDELWEVNRAYIRSCV